MANEARATVGMLHEVTGVTGVVVGRQVAVDQLLLACSALSQRHRFVVYAPDRQVELLRSQLGAARQLEVRPLGALAPDAVTSDPVAAGPREATFDAWHENQFDTTRPFAIRARLGAAHPVTITHHTLSYPSLLHEAILPLLLAGTAPYDAIICTSDPAAEALRQLIDHVSEGFAAEHGTKLDFAGRLVTIPLGVDTDRFRPMDAREARERFELPADAFVVLWLGRLSAVDKADLLPLVRMFAELVGARAEARPLLVCAGTQRPGEQLGDVIDDYARQLGIGESVVVLTDRDRFMPWLPTLYAAADAFVSPIDNVQETFGLTPIEAMACGVPALVSDWNGYRDTVVDGESGMLIPTTWCDCTAEVSAGSLFAEPAFDHLALAQSVAVDMGALRATLEQLIDDPALGARLGAQGRTRALERFDWRVVIARYEELWIELAAEARTAPRLFAHRARYAQPDYARAFAHFASRQLAGDQPLQLSALGERLIGGQEGLASHHVNTWQHLNTQLLQRILAGFARVPGGQLTADRIVQVITKKQGGELLVARVRRHLMWLLKYDLVRCASRPLCFPADGRRSAGVSRSE